MKKWALIVDVARCTNCQNCVLATRDEHTGIEPGEAATSSAWITIERRVRGNDTMVDVTYLPKTCNHCEDAPCVRAAGDGSIYRRPDGIVIIDSIKARGRRDLLDSCPYGAIHWNEKTQAPEKWSFDAHLLDGGWREPRCVQACPSGAMQSFRLTDAELEERRARESLEELAPELQTRPRLLYRNLRRTTGLFLGGTVTRRLPQGSVDNVADAQVELVIAGTPPATCRSDSFGDFKFDDLPARAPWTLQVSHPEHGRYALGGALSESCYLGPLELA